MSVDTFEVEAAPGDRLLLCSDGLTGMVADRDIERILGTAPSAAEAVDRLIEAANDAGGQDNITVVVAEIGADARHTAHVRRAQHGSADAAGSASGARVWGARLLWVLLLVAIVAGAAYGAWAYARAQAFVIDEGGRVAVYRGVPGTLGSVELRWLEEVTNIPVGALDPVTATRLGEGVRVEDIVAAYDLVARYRLETGVSSDATGSIEPTSTP
jgi:protein phosphatase